MSTFDIVGLIETWSGFKGEFSSVLNGFTLFDCVRRKTANALRNSGGVGVFVKNSLLKDGFVTHICQDFADCVVLYCKSSVFHNMSDMIIYFAYISPEGSSVYNNLDEKNGISILENNITTLRNNYPESYMLVILTLVLKIF